MSERWTRRSGASLTETAMQAGIRTPAEAEAALMVGARFQAHGFTGAEIDRMILDHYHRTALESHRG